MTWRHRSESKERADLFFSQATYCTLIALILGKSADPGIN
jgi:hypothetical protein